MFAYEYSEKELELINVMGMFDIAQSPHMPPVLLYREMSLQCFRAKIEGDIGESVRKCLFAVETGDILRLTKEFDNLISF